MTQFYKQYKSIKPYLQRDTPSPDVSRMFRLHFEVDDLILTSYLLKRVVKTASRQLTERSLTACMNVFSVLAARPLAPPTGGTVKNTLDLLSSSNPTDG